MTPLSTFLVEPVDPVIFGDGRPFTAVAGSRSVSSALPWPSTLAGALRGRDTRAIDAGGHFDVRQVDTLKAEPVLGPFAVLLDDAGQVQDWLFVAPADAVWVRGAAAGGRPDLAWCRPLQVPPGATVQSEGPGGAPLGAPVGVPLADPRKPARAIVSLWRYSGRLEEWLAHPGDRADVDPHDWGVEGPVPEPRVHVSLRPDTATAEDGALFGTVGTGWWTRGARLSLACRARGKPRLGISPLGGERRMASFREARGAPFPSIPAPVVRSAREGAVRVLLATAGRFDAGHRPDRLLAAAPPGSELVGQIHGRAVAASGFSLDLRSPGPRPVRRLVPAGAVFFLRLGGDPDSREEWARAAWGAPLGPATDRTALDGHGVALLGAWDGRPSPLRFPEDL